MNQLLPRDREIILSKLRSFVASGGNRGDSLRAIAHFLREAGGYRWVGLYDVDSGEGIVRNVAWSGPGAPEYPTFPVTKGLTGSAISTGKTVNVGDVNNDPRYLTAFGSTRSEIIVPVFDESGTRVAGTLDVESEQPQAFGQDVQSLLEACAEAIRPLWSIVVL